MEAMLKIFSTFQLHEINPSRTTFILLNKHAMVRIDQATETSVKLVEEFVIIRSGIQFRNQKLY